jgi:molybdopterin synthase sulfur carrier subunit
MLSVRYFARLREDLGRSDETVEPPAHVTDVAGLRSWLAERGEPWAHALRGDRAVRVAVNLEMARDGTPLKAGDEVAFFPPVTGG